MKRHHAAALVLWGWYLMAPPQVYTEPNSRVSIPPFDRTWRVLTQTDNADECARALEFGLTHKTFTMGKMRDALRYGGMCVRSDDPRINPNPPTPIPENER
jgi:hypothetical protein